MHLAAALPEARWFEYSYLNHDHLVETPVRIEGGYAIAPSGAGHGLVLSARAREELASPDPALDERACEAPPSTSRLHDALA